jgi:hypothetical protein
VDEVFADCGVLPAGPGENDRRMLPPPDNTLACCIAHGSLAFIWK